MRSGKRLKRRAGRASGSDQPSAGLLQFRVWGAGMFRSVLVVHEASHSHVHCNLPANLSCADAWTQNFTILRPSACEQRDSICRQKPLPLASVCQTHLWRLREELRD